MLVDCEPLTDSRRAAYIQRVGYVSQSSYIFNGPVAENVAFSQWGKPYDEERVLLPEYTASLISKEFTEQQGNRLGTTCCPSGTICISNENMTVQAGSTTRVGRLFPGRFSNNITNCNIFLFCAYSIRNGF